MEEPQETNENIVEQEKNENTQNNENIIENKKKDIVEKKIKLWPFIVIAAIICGFIAAALVEKYLIHANGYGASTWNGGPVVVKKPIIYIYPTKELSLSVRLGKPENITYSYPDYRNGWNVIAEPDGTLTDTTTGRKLYALYWEGKYKEDINFDEGFVVEGENAVEFLEEKLAIFGLNERESEEFIIYWLPKLQENKYNLIRFASMDEINEYMPLELSEKPDTLIRVLMQFKALDEYTEIKEQELTPVNREGFTVVEWGGTEVK